MKKNYIYIIFATIILFVAPFSASASLRTISLDDSEHLLHNHHASVAALRLLFTFAPERRSASFRNRCSPSPEYPETIIALCDLHIGSEYPTRSEERRVGKECR